MSDRVPRSSLAEAGQSRVTVAGRPLCVTTHSAHLDPDVGGRASFINRDAAAARIALCWNACRHLSDDELRKANP